MLQSQKKYLLDLQKYFLHLQKLLQRLLIHGLDLTTWNTGYAKSILTTIPTIRTAKSDGEEESS